MTPGDLYERCVALGLCERAKYGDFAIHYKQGHWWMEDRLGMNPAHHHVYDSLADLACMTVLRALMKIKVGPVQLIGNESEPWYFASFLGFNDRYAPPENLHAAQSRSILESLCLCLLRANGHVESEKE